MTRMPVGRELNADADRPGDDAGDDRVVPPRVQRLPPERFRQAVVAQLIAYEALDHDAGPAEVAHALNLSKPVVLAAFDNLARSGVTTNLVTAIHKHHRSVMVRKTKKGTRTSWSRHRMERQLASSADDRDSVAVNDVLTKLVGQYVDGAFPLDAVESARQFDQLWEEVIQTKRMIDDRLETRPG